MMLTFAVAVMLSYTLVRSPFVEGQTESLGPSATDATTLTHTQPPTATTSTVAAPSTDMTSTSEGIVHVFACTCDITTYSCDINCCCDPDCSKEDSLVFTSCDEVVSHPSHRICISSADLFLFNPEFPATLSTDLFCVSQNLAKELNYNQLPDLITNSSMFSVYEREFPHVSYLAADFTTRLATSASYRDEDPIITLNKMNSTDILRLPRRGLSSDCLDASPARYLLNESTSCSRRLGSPISVICGMNMAGYLNPLNYYDSMRVLDTPPNDADIYSSSTLALETQGVVSSPLYNASSGVCSGVLTELHYTVLYSGGAITNVSIQITTGDIDDSTVILWQRFSIVFVDRNAQRQAYRGSGNPGYLVGEPVIAGQYTGPSIAMDDDRFNRFTLLAPSLNTNCIGETAERIPVLFGENLYTGCRLQLNESFTLPGQCESLFTRSLSALLGPTITLNGSTYIASLGNSRPSQPEEWLPLLLTSSPADPASCGSLAMNIEILFSSIGSRTKPQSLIAGARASFITLQTISSVTLQKLKYIDVISTLSFIDITDANVTSQDSSYAARALNDFLYPMGNMGAKSTLTLNSALAIMLVLYA